MLYGTTIMQKFIEHCHMLCIHSGLISYIENIISFNRVTDIQYFIALEGDAVQPSYALVWGSRCKVFSGAILRHYAIYNVSERPVSLRVFTQGEWGRSLCKCFSRKDWRAAFGSGMTEERGPNPIKLPQNHFLTSPVQK